MQLHLWGVCSSSQAYLLDVSIQPVGEEPSGLGAAKVDNVEDLRWGAAEGNGVLVSRNKVGCAISSHNTLYRSKATCQFVAMPE